MFIPMSMNVSNDAEIQDGNVEKVCRFCNRRFSVPAAEADNYKTNVCEECESEYDKQIAEATAALMKDQSEATEAIKTALGN